MEMIISVSYTHLELVLESLFGYMNIPYNANAIQIHRLDVYAKEGDKFVSLLDMGEEIA